MAIRNNVMIVRQTLLTRLIEMWNAGELVEKIYELAGEHFNINSTQQLGKILFEKLKKNGVLKLSRFSHYNKQLTQVQLFLSDYTPFL